MMEFRNYGTCFEPVLGKGEKIPLIPQRISRQYEGTKLMGMCKTSFFFSIYLIIYVMFLFSGAAVFSVLETPPERAARARLDGAVQKFRSDNPNVTGLCKKLSKKNYKNKQIKCLGCYRAEINGFWTRE